MVAICISIVIIITFLLAIAFGILIFIDFKRTEHTLIIDEELEKKGLLEQDLEGKMD